MIPPATRTPEEIARAREHAAGYAYRIGRLLLRAAEAAFEAQSHAHDFPVAFSLKPAIDKAREAADLAVEWSGKVDMDIIAARDAEPIDKGT